MMVGYPRERIPSSSGAPADYSLERVREFEARVGARSEARDAVGKLGALADLLQAGPGPAKRHLLEGLTEDAERLYQTRLRQFAAARPDERRRLLEEIADAMIRSSGSLSARTELLRHLEIIPEEM